jgi:hypothetical protein
VPLVGEIAGISLADLLQVAALAGERGLLEIHSGEATAWIAFEAGAIVRLARSDRDQGPAPGSAAAAEAGSDPKASEDDPSLAEAESELLDLLSWREGNFRLRCSPVAMAWPGPQGWVLPVPLRPESIALEAARRVDEERRTATPDHPLGEESTPRAPVAAVLPPAVVVVDSELWLLEGLKEELARPDLRVHVFPRSEEAWFRIQQYLKRGEVPALVLGADVSDPVEPGYRPGWRRFAGRLRRIAPGAPVILLSVDESAESSALHAAVQRPVRINGTPEDMRRLAGSIERVLGLGT